MISHFHGIKINEKSGNFILCMQVIFTLMRFTNFKNTDNHNNSNTYVLTRAHTHPLSKQRPLGMD